MASECSICDYTDNIAIISFTGSFIAESAFSAIKNALVRKRVDIILDLSSSKRMQLSSILDFARIKAMIEKLQGRFIISSPPEIFHLLNASLGDTYKFNICKEIGDAVHSLIIKKESQDVSYKLDSVSA